LIGGILPKAGVTVDMQGIHLSDKSDACRTD
jgi:hypothetical protein